MRRKKSGFLNILVAGEDSLAPKGETQIALRATAELFRAFRIVFL